MSNFEIAIIALIVIFQFAQAKHFNSRLSAIEKKLDGTQKLS